MKQRVFKVFYRDYPRGVAVSSAHPEALLATRIAGLAERLLGSPDNFLGVVDRNDVILQLYREDGGLIAVELLRPDTRVYLQTTMTLAQALDLVADLPEALGPELLPDAHRVGAED